MAILKRTNLIKKMRNSPPFTFGVEITIRGFNTFNALRWICDLSIYSEVISCTFEDKRIPPRRKHKARTNWPHKIISQFCSTGNTPSS